MDTLKSRLDVGICIVNLPTPASAESPTKH